MPSETAERTRSRCMPCGFEAPFDSERWTVADHPSLGTLTACPECGSTNVVSL